MTDENPQSAIRNPQSPQVIRVREGCRCVEDGKPVRLFSVVLDRPSGDDLAIVAGAADPEMGSPDSPRATAIPAAGSEHPDGGFVARPPEIHPVGLRHKGGAMISRQSCFYNVRVRYNRSQSPVAGSQAGKEADAAAGLASPPATGHGLPATDETEGSV